MEFEIGDVLKHWWLVLAGGIGGIVVWSWYTTGDPFSFFRSFLPQPAAMMPAKSGAATTNSDVLESFIPADTIYSSWPEDYPMGPQYTQRSYDNTAEDFQGMAGYTTRPYQRSFHANQVVDNHESWEITRDHDGNIIGISGSRQVSED